MDRQTRWLINNQKTIPIIEDGLLEMMDQGLAGGGNRLRLS